MTFSNKTIKSISFLLFILFITLASSLFVIKKVIEPLVSSISGKVIKGEGVSKLYGFPTANIRIKEKLPCGVFDGKSQYGKTTVMSDGKGYVEAHIHNFNKNIYGKELKIENIDYIKGIDSKERRLQDCKFVKLKREYMKAPWSEFIK